MAFRDHRSAPAAAEEPAAWTTGAARRYDGATRSCDVVLKGGVTSGIVYPLALCELATAYRFRRVGGASSGAIVAAFAAAAEHGRQDAARAAPHPRRELDAGFAGLEQLAARLAEPGKLLAVFLPDPATKPIFDVLLAGQLEQARGRAGGADADAGPARPWASALLALWARTPSVPPIVGGAVALLATLALAWPAGSRIAALVHAGPLAARLAGDLLAVGVVVLLLLATAAGAAAGALLALHHMVLRQWVPAVVGNGFGLARGMRRPLPSEPAVTGSVDGSEPYALTVWMTRIVNELAGRDAEGPPLTFGDLWSVAEGSAPAPTIRLELITTCLTLGRPLRLPQDLDRDPPFYFDPDEWRDYFPQRVVDALVRASPEERRRVPGSRAGPRYFRLPPPHAIPVVVAARLSAAFPLLISATPLWSVDMNSRGAREHAERPLERCWFSDGGLGSNFPVHLFDQLIPRWPTFAIDLRPASPESGYRLDPDDERRNVWMPLRNEAGRTERWTRLERHRGAAASPPRALLRFGVAAVETMQSWRDNTLATQSGFRDRIVHVKLDAEREGGLNIAMPSSVARRLTARGAAAGALLRHRYTITEEALARENEALRQSLSADEAATWRPTTVSWENHRWIRFRTAMAALQRSLEVFEEAYRSGPGYEPLVTRAADAPPPEFRWTDFQRDARPERATAELIDAVARWRASTPAMRFDEGELPPEPRPELRLAPPV